MKFLTLFILIATALLLGGCGGRGTIDAQAGTAGEPWIFEPNSPPQPFWYYFPEALD